MGLTEQQINQLEKWTSKSLGRILFDSDWDYWEVDNSMFNDRIDKHDKVMFVVFQSNGEQYGYYHATTIDILSSLNSKQPIPTSADSFHFNIQSNGRLSKMMKFDILERKCSCKIYKEVENQLIDIGELTLYKENFKNYSHYHQYSTNFNYHGIENALTGLKYASPMEIDRIVVFTMK